MSTCYVSAADYAKYFAVPRSIYLLKGDSVNQALAPRDETALAIEQSLIGGDLSKLTPAQRVSYYRQVCDSLGLNPLTKPFAYITLNGKLTLYALKDCTEQLRNNHQIAIQIKAREVVEGCYVVTATASSPMRTDESIGAVPIVGLKGEALANAMMKAETKAKRRVTLSICGLGMLDESEADSIPHGGYTVEAPTALTAAVSGPPTESDGDSQRRPDGAELSAGAVRPADSNALTIVRVENRPTANKNVTKHVIVLGDGRELSTIKTKLGALAEELAQDGAAVEVLTTSTKRGEELISLRRAEPVLPMREPGDEPRTADDITF